MSEKNVLNFNEFYNITKSDILNSSLLKRIVESYFKENKLEDEILKDLLLKIAITINKNEDLKILLKSLDGERKEKLLLLINDIYDFYRSKERYLIYVKDETNVKLTHREFVKEFMKFSDKVVSFYRDIYEGILSKEQTVYRILPSGGNVGIIFSKENLPLSSSFSYLNNIPLLESIVNQPPFIVSTKENKRVGFFHFKNEKINKKDLNIDDFYSILIKINKKCGLIVVNKEYLSFLASIGNLFEVTSFDEKINKVDFIVFYGIKNINDCYYYYHDNTLVGVLGKEYKIDYFGYMKKMILTLYNLLMINENNLPIHGAGFTISDGKKEKNIVILGDSGAGKSETLEAIKNEYNGKYHISPIFDDMGTFFIKDNKVYTSGTEIGAFVRLDDLEQSYSLNSMDRAIFFNIEKPNSRVVIPLLSYLDSIKLYQVDAFFLADNFSIDKEKIHFYNDLDVALIDFKKGERVALNTTNEKGKVSTYFANPFGPLQEKEKVETFISSYFKLLKDNNIPLGKILTSLSFDKNEGPKEAAKALIEFFNNN